MIAILALICLAPVLGVLAILLALRDAPPEVDHLNLTLETPMDLSVLTTQKPQFSIHPSAAGKPATVADLTDVKWVSSDENVATVALTKEDGSSAELRPVAAGTVTVTVSGTNRAGNVVSDTATVTFAEPVVVVDALNLQSDGNV